MKLLHLDMVGGIAGDMTVAALTHLGAPLDPLRRALDAMGLEGLEIRTEPVAPSGIGALRFEVRGADGQAHPHRTLPDVLDLIGRAGLPAAIGDRIARVFRRLAEAEGAVHGVAVDQVTFHEVGALDSIADIVGVVLAVDHLAPDRITASPPVVGSDTVDSRHGPLPVPAPATLQLLRGLPVVGLPVAAELTTPTGAAILAELCDSFGPWPAMRPEAIGYGAGTRELPGRPNLLRAVLGEASEAASDEWLVEANIDDMSPEHYAHLIERLLEAGAHDAWLTPVQMKKGRPAIVIGILCDEDHRDATERTLFCESTTIGLRRQRVERRKLARRTDEVQTPWGPVRVKVASEGDRIYTASPEYEDCRALARSAGVPLADVYEAARAAWRAIQENP